MTGRWRVRAVVLCAVLAAGSGGSVPQAMASAWVVPLGSGSAGEAAAGTLLPPTGLTSTCGTGVDKAKITVGWTAVAGAAAYSVLQSTTSATTGFTTAATGVTGTTWTSPAGTNNTTYWYKVVAVAGNWTGPQSTETVSRSISGNSCV